MQIRTFEELTAPDERTLRFTSMGLSTMGTLPSESAAKFQQSVIAHCDLHDEVPAGTRASFERLRTLHSYGVLCYEAFTVAEDLAWLLLEQALRERFIEFHGGTIPLVHAKTGETRPIQATDYSVIDDAFRPNGSHVKGAWLLPLTDGTTMEFRGSMAQLQDWARREGLLDGQRNKRLDSLYRKMRNNVAHPRYHLAMPVDSARTIRDLAEIINRLWGGTTPGGRLYPAPLEREVLVVAWTDASQGFTHTLCRGEQLERFTEPGNWTCVIVLGVREDEGVWEFDAQYERSNFPADLLWGPGTREEALRWLEENSPEGDMAPYLDRLFAVHIHNGRVSLPRRPEVALALPHDRREGRWLLVRADFPIDALVHARHLKDGVACGGSRPRCAIEEVLDGDWTGLVAELRRIGISTAAMLRDAKVRPRCFGVASDVEAD